MRRQRQRVYVLFILFLVLAVGVGIVAVAADLLGKANLFVLLPTYGVMVPRTPACPFASLTHGAAAVGAHHHWFSAAHYAPRTQ